jgi:hypothetical protein
VLCLDVRRCVWCVGELTRLKRVGSFRVDARVSRRERVWRFECSQVWPCWFACGSHPSRGGDVHLACVDLH